MELVAFWQAFCAPRLQNRLGERGASLVEYALLVALIAVVCIGAVTFLGGIASNKLSSVGGAISSGNSK